MGVLKRAKRWHHFSEDIHSLPVRQNIGRALTYKEKVKLLHRAGTRLEWQTVACAHSLRRFEMGVCQLFPPIDVPVGRGAANLVLAQDDVLPPLRSGGSEIIATRLHSPR